MTDDWTGQRPRAALTQALALLLAISAGAPALIYALTAPADCAELADHTGLETRWTFWRNCQVRDPSGAWVSARGYGRLLTIPGK